MTYIIEGFFILLLVYPLNILLHELSHALAVILFGGEVIKINIGSGKTILKLGRLHIHQWYWNRGDFSFKNLENDKILSRIIILLSGPLSNLLFALILYFINLKIASNDMSEIFITWAMLVFLTTIIPSKFLGRYSDGLQIYQLIKTGKSEFMVSNKSLESDIDN